MSNTLIVPEEMTREKIELIKRTVAVGTSDDELALFLYTAKRTGLDPLSKQIHAIMRWNKSANRHVMTIQTAIDGYRLIADRTGKLAGISDPVFDDETKANPNKASVTVKKIVEGHICEFTASARWSEYAALNETGGFMWKKMPYLMLGKCAEALALRKAFPADLSGVYTNEEMAQADTVEGRKVIEAEIERQKAEPASIPPEPEFHYTPKTGMLICRVIYSAQKQSQGKDKRWFAALKIDGVLDDVTKSNMIFSWHTSTHEALAGSKGKLIKCVVEQDKKGFYNITELLEVDGVKFVKPEEPKVNWELQAREAASILAMTEEELMKLLGMTDPRNSWEEAAKEIKKEIARQQKSRGAAERLGK